eukprot:7218972-Prymnesium_polylepis.1
MCIRDRLVQQLACQRERSAVPVWQIILAHRRARPEEVGSEDGARARGDEPNRRREMPGRRAQDAHGAAHQASSQHHRRFAE